MCSGGIPLAGGPGGRVQGAGVPWGPSPITITSVPWHPARRLVHFGICNNLLQMHLTRVYIVICLHLLGFPRTCACIHAGESGRHARRHGFKNI